ncbi:hypothetical protein SAMN02799632_03275 [Acinetobacter pittii]|nr:MULTISPECIES: hypothetical protein [Acinetobacter calcoaceticus/baumannii complex]KCX98596.1 hypothetical protein J584_1028 [Acinetobacter sp. 72431]MBJ8449589.1 hypothetical protein [Acinetobacter pittii]MBJ8488605.1 hypothetical protein [Acinetobacter pittii]MCU4465726.1 hypothetical protein [Acinetobacter pittii]MEB3805662.1 hypothetical protein [Acinetobacter pittii]
MDKKALQEQFEEFARWYVLPLDKSEDGIYRALETQSAWKSFQHQQAKVEELKASHHGEVIGHEVHFKKIKQERDELQTLYIQQGINMLKLQKRVDALTQTMEEVLEEMKYPTATFEEVIVCGVKVLEQALKGEGQ